MKIHEDLKFTIIASMIASLLVLLVVLIGQDDKPIETEDNCKNVMPIRFYSVTPIDTLECEDLLKNTASFLGCLDIEFEFAGNFLGDYGSIQDYNGGDSYEWSVLSEMYSSDTLTVIIFPVDEARVCSISTYVRSCKLAQGWSNIAPDEASCIAISNFAFTRHNILAHEMGHYLGLRHTFDPYEEIYDTPLDPGAVYDPFVNYSKCRMEHSAYHPMINNMMAYYGECENCKKEFSPDQESVMQCNLLTVDLVWETKNFKQNHDK